MRRLIITAAALAALAIPATAAAAPPNKADKREARQECRAERGTTKESKKAFKQEHGSFGKCVSRQAREAKAERREARRNAAQECREERGETEESREAFREQYGTNANRRNAFGKCVSQKARENEDEEEA